VAILLLVPAGVIGGVSPLPCRPGTWGFVLCQLIGWILFASGAVFRWWAILYVGGKKLQTLVVDGPYSITRNPIYLGTCLLTLSAAVFSQSLLFFVAVLVVAVAYVRFTVIDEERALLELHQDRFREYCQRVPRLFPDFRLLSAPKSVDVQLTGMAAEFRRTCRWAWIPLLCQLLSQFRCEPWWPHWFLQP
jgi:protein-S-isoprenylcysteine O-methyltransferase Ste14